MTGNIDVDDQAFWKERIGLDETLLWMARASKVGSVTHRVLAVLLCGFGVYVAYDAIFISSSADQFCEAFDNRGCGLFFYFAWPILIFSLILCAFGAFGPLMLQKGWSIRRYAITNQMAYVSATGLLNANRSVLVTSQPPTIINGHILTISNKISFGGLTDFEIKTAIAAIIEFQRGAK